MFESFDGKWLITNVTVSIASMSGQENDHHHEKKEKQEKEEPKAIKAPRHRIGFLFISTIFFFIHF